MVEAGARDSGAAGSVVAVVMVEAVATAEADSAVGVATVEADSVVVVD